MSRPAHLPPRRPLQNRIPVDSDSSPQNSRNDNNFSLQRHGFPSHGSLLNVKSSWVDDLLTDREISPKGVSLRRSSSDPVTLLDVASSFHWPILPINEEEDESDSEETNNGATDSYCQFEAGNCIYGPNSPRYKSKLTKSETMMVTAVLENVPCNPLQYLALDSHSVPIANQQNGKEEVHAAASDPDSDKLPRRRTGQRSRVRKLQYIAELEKTVDMLQTMGADLGDRVICMLEQRVALSVENNSLRRQIAGLRQEKIMKDVEYQSLKNEAERLNVIAGHRHRRSKSDASCFEMSLPVVDPTSINWQMLNMRKLSFGGAAQNP